MGERSITRSRIYSQCEIQWISRHENEFSSREISVSHPTDEFITCHSCDFRYPQSRGVCVMCGEPARTTAPTQVSTDLRSASRPPKHLEGTIFGEPSQSIERQGRGKS